MTRSLETDASDNTISATLNLEEDSPAACFSIMLNKCELYYSSDGKQALANIDAVRKWGHFRSGGHFTVMKDQRLVSFMYSGKNRDKIQNDSIVLAHGTKWV